MHLLSTFTTANNMPGTTTIDERPVEASYDVARTRLDKPLSYTGSLDSYEQSDLTPVIGTEFEGLQVTELLATGNDALIRDLAVTVSQRGVVFLRNQDVTPNQMRELMERITQQAGCVCVCDSYDSRSSLLLTQAITARIIWPARPPTH